MLTEKELELLGGTFEAVWTTPAYQLTAVSILPPDYVETPVVPKEQAE